MSNAHLLIDFCNKYNLAFPVYTWTSTISNNIRCTCTWYSIEWVIEAPTKEQGICALVKTVLRWLEIDYNFLLILESASKLKTLSDPCCL